MKETMLGVYQTRLEELAGAADTNRVKELLDPLAGRDVPAMMWRRILGIASRYPQMLGRCTLTRSHQRPSSGDGDVRLAAESALAACFESSLRISAGQSSIRSCRCRRRAVRPTEAKCLAPGVARTADRHRHVRLQRAESLTEHAQPEETPWPAEFLEDAPPQLERRSPTRGHSLHSSPPSTSSHNAPAPCRSTGPSRRRRSCLGRRAANPRRRGLKAKRRRGPVNSWSVQVGAREPLSPDDATDATEILVGPARPRLSQPDDLEDGDHGPDWGFPAGRVDAAEVSWLSHRETDCQTMG